MKVLERYTLRQYCAPLLWCFGIFLGLYLVFDLLGHLDEILRSRLPFKILLLYYGMMMPLIFVQVAPFACLMATLYTLGNLNRHQELMAMRASGLGPFQIVRPILLMGLLVSLGVLVVNEWISPQAALMTQSIKANYLERVPDLHKKIRPLKTIEHLATYGSGYILLYAKTFDPIEKNMTGVVILQHGANLSLRRKITAESAVWTGTRWRFLNGTILQFDSNEQPVGRPVWFNAKFIQAGDRPEILLKSENLSLYMNSKDLMDHIRRMKGAGSSMIRRLSVDLYAKSAAAFACLVLTLIGIPYAIQPTRGGGAALGLSLGLGVGLAFYATNALLLALGKGGWLPPIIAAWGTLAVFTYLGFQQIRRRFA